MRNLLGLFLLVLTVSRCQQPLVYDPTNFTPRKGVMTRYAKKMVRPEFYGKIYVKDLANV